jgi:spoIIIJ-associated protein
MEPQQRLRLDSDGYRARREASLQRLALSAARKALKRERPTYLEPMSSWERRIIHMTLKERTDIETRSIGDEPSRKVVVWPSRTEKRTYRRR